MKYQGGKNKLAKEIVKTMNIVPTDRFYDLFCGGCNVIEHVSCAERYANDKHMYLISLFKGIQDGYIPPDQVDELTYKQCKNNPLAYPIELRAFVGFGCSYSGKWWGGYARTPGSNRNHCLESKLNLLKQKDKLKDVIFTNLNYWEVDIKPNSVIYCDPPYANTTKYSTDSFDYESFYEWCYMIRPKVKQLYVSEYNMPYGWTCIWQKEHFNSIRKKDNLIKPIEKLFILK